MKNLRIRVALFILRDDEILLVRHEKDGRSYWLLPGGGVEFGESLKEAARREAFEETGLDVEVHDLVLLWETLPPDNSRHGVNMCFHATVKGGTLRTQTDERLREAAYVPMRALPTLPMHPPLGEPLAAILSGVRTPLFLGPRWTD